MIEPPPCSAMCRPARWVPTITPNRFTAITRSKSRRSSRRKRRNELEMPALLNMTCSPPKVSTAKSTSAWTSSASATSVRLKATPSPSPAASASPLSASTSATTTLAPSAGEQLGGGAADPAGTPRDDGDLPRQFLAHVQRFLSTGARHRGMNPASSISRRLQRSGTATEHTPAGRPPTHPPRPSYPSDQGTCPRPPWSTSERRAVRIHRLLRHQGPHRQSLPLLRAPARAVPGGQRALPRCLHGDGLRRGGRGLPRPGDLLDLQLGHRALRQVPGATRG